MTEESTTVAPPLPLWAAKIRLPFLTATAIPVCLGVVIAWARAGAFHLGYFLVTLVGALCLHASANMLNDYFDYTWGSDNINTEYANPFTGGSRVIQQGLAEPREILWQGITLFVVGCVSGFFLAFVRGPGILWIGLLGGLTAFFYTAPPLRLVRLGLGELVLGLDFGPLMVLGSYYVQAQAVAWEPVIASLPVALLITLVLWINQFQDVAADAAVGKTHWVVRLGRRRATRVYGAGLALTYLTLSLGVLVGITPVWVLVGWVTAPLAVKAYRVARAHYDDPRRLIPANAATVRIHWVTGVLLILGYLVQGLWTWLT